DPSGASPLTPALNPRTSLVPKKALLRVQVFCFRSKLILAWVVGGPAREVAEASFSNSLSNSDAAIPTPRSRLKLRLFTLHLRLPQAGTTLHYFYAAVSSPNRSSSLPVNL